MLHVDRWAFLVAVFAVLALTVTPMIGCGDDDDDDDDDDVADDDDTGDDDNDTGDDDDDDDDTTDDDTADDDDDWVEITPGAQMIPVGTTYAFTAEGQVDGAAATTFSWSIGDDEVATVVDGVVTAVAPGQATLTVTAGTASAQALIAVGPDVYSFDNLNGVATAIDRGDQSAIADLAGGSIGAVIQNVAVDTENGLLYYVDSADYAGGVTGNEKLIMVDLLDEYATTDISLNQDSPWAATVFSDAVWVTGNLDDTLAKVTVAGMKASVEYFDLDEGCAPTAVLGVGTSLYVACSGFDWGTMAYDDGKLLVINPTTGTILSRIELPQVNPNGLAVAASADCSDLFVVCTGNYSDQTGKIVKVCTHENVVKSSFDLGIAPGPIGISAEGIAFVGEGLAGNVYVFDTADNSIIHGDADPLTIPDAFWVQGLGVLPETGDAYVCDQGNGKVYVLAGDDYSDVFNVALPNPGGVAFW